jgi:DNA repair protein RecO (recombination protein O)
MITTTRAIVLNNLRYGDSSLIVDLYTEKMGRQTVFVKGVFGKKTTVRSALFQPLNMLETNMHHRANREMQRISNIQIYYPFHNIPYEPVKNCIALFIAEILYKTLKEEEANGDLFEFIIHTVQTLDLNESGTANFHLAFLVHFSRYLGFYVKYDNLLPQLSEISFDNLSDLKINHHRRNSLTKYLLEYYSANVDNFGNMKSFQVLQNVFQD